MSESSKITCPNCKTSFDVNDSFNQQLQTRLNTELAKEQQKMALVNEQFRAEKEAFELKKLKENELFAERLQSKIKEEKLAIEKQLKEKLQNENEERYAELQKELNEKSLQLQELNKSKAEIERLKREKEEMRSLIEVENAQKLTEALVSEKEKIKLAEQERTELKMRELQKQLDDQKKLTEEMKRKQDQGSMQLQGEVQELAMEEWLRSNFPLDTVVEVKKGQRGADCRQIINTRSKEACGIIYYESKRTKEFGAGWIEKFKNDIRENAANLGVLVTDVMPAGMDRMGLRDGVWICSFEEFKGLSFVLRENIIALDSAISAEENKGDKMVMLYQFLTSNEFKLQVEGIIEGYSQMFDDLQKEKRAITGTWKKRETQLQKVLLNTNYMYNSLRGIAGNAIQTISTLELSQGFDELED